MKRLVLIVAASVMCLAASAQVGGFKLDKKAILNAIERSDADIAHPKRSGRGQTWMDRGDAMFKAAGGYMLSETYPGQPEAEMLLRLGKAEPANVTVNDRNFQVYSYPYADVYLINGVVQFWVIKEVLYEGADDKAIEAYKKAAELDSKLTEKASAGIVNVSDVVSIAANAQYNLGNSEAAADLYWKNFNIKKEPLVGKIDSISVYNAGNIYLFAEKYDRATEILEAALENNVWEEGRTPYYLSYAYMQVENFDKAKEVLDKGLAKFPGDKNMIESMISYYAMTEGDFNEIKDMLEEALKSDPENVGIWNGLAMVYADTDDKEKAMEFFTKYAERFPDSAQANYYLGDAWYTKGDDVRMAMESDRTMSKASRDAAAEEAKTAYRNAWKYLKAAYESDPTQAAILQRYFYTTYHLIDDPGMQELFDKLQPEWDAMNPQK